MWTTRVCAIVPLLLAACTGSIEDRAAGDEPASGSSGGGAARPADEGGGSGGGGPVPPRPAACTGPNGGATALRLRRLTRTEYDNTVRDLVGDTTAPADRFAVDETIGPFANNAIAPIATLMFEQYQDAAETLAARAVTKLATLLPCDPLATGEDACALQFIKAFGRRAFRRPLDAPEVEALRLVYANAWADLGEKPPFAARIRLVLSAILQSPSFLYRAESGTPVAGTTDVLRLGDYEMASRLSYFLWASTPDAALLDAAAAKTLSTPQGLRDQAARMMRDPKISGALGSFHVQWLGVDDLETTTKDAKVYPTFDDNVRKGMLTETRLFVDSVIRDGDGRLETLLASPVGFVTPALAPIYGVKYPGQGTDALKVPLAPAERAGLVTQAGFLATHAKSNQSSPVRRGVAVRERLLCQTLPPPPPNVNVVPPDPRPDATTRERFSQHTVDPTCAGCHKMIDPIGFGFEAYDGIGRFRRTDAGRPVDASGEIVGAGDLDGRFDGAVDLAGRLARSEQVRGCVGGLWLQFAIGRPTGPADACSTSTAMAEFAASGYDVRKLLLSIVATDAFRYGRKP
jgi:hypothetical protein